MCIQYTWIIYTIEILYINIQRSFRLINGYRKRKEGTIHPLVQNLAQYH